MISPCLNCGSCSTYVNAQARGPAQYHFDKWGNFIETEYDKLWFKKSHVVRCADCGKIRRDLRLAEGRLAVVKAEAVDAGGAGRRRDLNVSRNIAVTDHDSPGIWGKRRGRD